MTNVSTLCQSQMSLMCTHVIWYRVSFLPRDCILARSLHAVERCLSVTFVFCIVSKSVIISNFFSSSKDTGHIQVFLYHSLWHCSNGNHLTAQKSRSGFGINDWWSVINNFDRRLIYSTKPRVSTSVYRAGRHASVNLVYNSKSRCYAEENRTEFNCMRWYHRC